MATEETHVYGYRWAVLLVFGLIFMVGQMMWLVFSLIRNEVTEVFGLAAGDPSVVLLTASQPLAFIILSIPIGLLADRKGLVMVAGLGAILQTLFGTLRIFVINDFTMIFACQFGLSVGSVMIQNCIVYLSVSWFPKRERGLATGVSTLFMLLGMLLGTALSYLLWTAPFRTDAGYTVALAQANVTSILYLDVFLAVILTVAFFAVARDKPPHPPDIDVLAEVTPSVRGMLKDRNVWFVSFGFFAGFGIFIGLTAIIEELLNSLGFLPEAGFGPPVIVMVLLLVFGIIGAVVVPAISDKVGKRKPFLMISLVVGVISTYVLGTSTITVLSYISAAILGFFLIAVMPIALSMLEEFKSVGPELSGASTGLAFWWGNLGGFLGTILLEALRVGPSYFYSIVYLVVVMAIATVLIFTIPETGRRTEAAQKKQHNHMLQ